MLIVAAVFGEAACRGDEPEKPSKPVIVPAPAVPILVNAPVDISKLLERYSRPDFVILRGDEYDRLLKKEPSTSSLIVPPRWNNVVESVLLSGVVNEEIVEFNLEFGIAKDSGSASWIPIRLDGQTLSGAKEEGRDLPIRVQNGVWEVELSNKGRHLVKVRLFMKVRQGADGNRIELAIPEAASTQVVLDVPRRVNEALAGPGESLTREYHAETSRTRLVADLIPRSKLALLWINEEEAVAQLPPLLVAQAEMAMDIDLGSLRTRTNWSIRSLRGVAKSLELVLNTEDEVLELELDGQPPPAGMERGKSSTKLTIPLTEPLGPGQDRKLSMTTRRATNSQGLTELTFKGYPLTNAREQSGVIAIVQSGNIGVSATFGRGVRQIDPRSELPGALRARPATTLAYQFSEQPFDLSFRIEPSPPLVRTESRTTLSLQSEVVLFDTWIDFQAARGRLFEVNLSVPASLVIDSIGPSDIVRTWQAGSLPASPGNSGQGAETRLLTIKLASKIQEGGRFSIELKGKTPLDRYGKLGIELVDPVGTISGGGRIAVLTDPSLTAELDVPNGPNALPFPFRAAVQTIPADWPWPNGKAPASPPALWIRHDLSTSKLPLEVIHHDRELRTSTELNVRVGRTAIEVEQLTDCLAEFGAFDSLDVHVPDILEGSWEVEGATIDRSPLVSKAKGQGKLVRLRLLSELSRSAKLKFRYRLPRDRSPVGETAVPWIGFAEPSRSSAPTTARISSEPALVVESADPSWTSRRDESAAVRPDFTLISNRDDLSSLKLRTRERLLAALPAVVIPRAWIRSRVNAKGEVINRVLYWVERHDGSLNLKLPKGAKISMAKVAREVIPQVEEIAEGGGLRIRFPSRLGREPALVEVESSEPNASGTARFAPEVLGSSTIQETYWEVALPNDRLLLGTPRGWVDENEWYWNAYSWKQRPRISQAALNDWILGVSAKGASPSTSLDPSHVYLFRTPGHLPELRTTVASRALLVGVCSGTVLIVGGILIVVRRPSPMVLAILIGGVVLGSAIAVEPAVILLIVQNGFVGLILTLLLAVMQQVVERRNPSLNRRQDRQGSSIVTPAGSTVSRTVGVGSDDSTAIRKRLPGGAEPSPLVGGGAEPFEWSRSQSDTVTGHSPRPLG